MSQVSIIDIEGNHPQIPTRFNANIGFAIPIANVLEIYGNTTPAGTNPVHTVGSGNNITTYVQISQAIAASNLSNVGLAAFDENFFSVDANGFVSFTGVTGDLHVARFIVSAGGSADGANYTSLSTAYAAAVSAGGLQTVFIQPGSYNIGTQALSPNVNIAAFDCDSQSPNVILTGKFTANFSGKASISGVQIATNADNAVSLSASSTIVDLINCNILASNLAFSVSAGQLNLIRCIGNLVANVPYFAISDGGINFLFCFMFNGVNATAINNATNTSAVNIIQSTFDSPITLSDSSSIGIDHSNLLCVNTTVIDCGGATMTNEFNNSRFESGTATAIIVGAGSTLTVSDISVFSSNTDAISGAGTLLYAPISFTSTSSNVTVATATPLRFGPSISPVMTDTNGTVYYDGTIIKTASPGSSGDVWTSNGAGTPPSFQPNSSAAADSFLAILSGSPGNVTGDGTPYHVAFDTVVFDTAGGFTTGGAAHYTFPTTGKWLITSSVCYSTSITSGSLVVNDLVASSNTFRNIQTITPANGQYITELCTTVLNVTAGDTVYVNANNVGGVAASTAILGSGGSPGTQITYISGHSI